MKPIEYVPRLLHPKAPDTDICMNCKFWVVRGDDPQRTTRCAAEPPKMLTVQIPQMDPETGNLTGMQLQVQGEFPPAPPFWSCGAFRRKIPTATELPPGPRSR